MGEAKAQRQNAYRNLCLKLGIKVDNAEIERMSRNELQRKINELRFKMKIWETGEGW